MTYTYIAAAGHWNGIVSPLAVLHLVLELLPAQSILINL